MNWRRILLWRRASDSSSDGARSWSWRRILWLGSALAVVALHMVLFPPTRSIESIELEVGNITDDEVRAPFTFAAARPRSELEAARREAAQRVEPVYRIVDGAEQRTEQRRRTLLLQIDEVASADSVSTADKLAVLQQIYPALTPTTLRVMIDPEHSQVVRDAVARVVRNQLSAGIVDITPRGTYSQIRILDARTQVETTRPLTTVVLGYRLPEALRAELQTNLDDLSLLDAAVNLAQTLLVPNLSYDDSETERRRAAAANAIPTDREYARNERILEAGVRVTRDHLDVLEALEAARIERDLEQDATIGVRLRVGRFLWVASVLGGMLFLIRQTDRRVVEDLNRYLALLTLVAMFLAISALVLKNPSWGGAVAAPVVLIAMLSTVLFGERVGARASLASALLLAVLPGNPAMVMVLWAAAMAATVRTIRKVRNRNQFYHAVGVVTVVYLVGITATTMGDAESWRDVVNPVGAGVASGVASTALCLFLLPLFEAVFGITTDLTLLELSDLNHPLLRRMSLESPGTYHHSQVVGSLAEAGARAIGANSLMARVGSNFHDIGKMLKPRYYVENQSGENRHDDLSPSMSALVIAAHVKDGMELGRQWGLPREVISYIPEHHGTSVMQYFYHKALENDPAGTVKVDDFRYPGPKPQTRETAIVMLADGVEASTRSLRRPTSSRIREMVRKIFDRKMAESELDECGLSLSDLAKVREAFIPILVGIHHQRVAYPGQEAHEKKKEKESLEARSRQRRSGTSVVS